MQLQPRPQPSPPPPASSPSPPAAQPIRLEETCLSRSLALSVALRKRFSARSPWYTFSFLCTRTISLTTPQTPPQSPPQREVTKTDLFNLVDQVLSVSQCTIINRHVVSDHQFSALKSTIRPSAIWLLGFRHSSPTLTTQKACCGCSQFEQVSD